MGKFEKLASGVYLEGLAVDYERNIVWYSDVIGGGVHGLLPDGTIETFNPERMWTGGILVNEDGSVLSSGAGGIMWNNLDTGTSGWLLHEIDGEIINGINEMAPDGSGGIYFGTCDIEMIQQAKPPRPAAIYRLTADRKVIRLVEGIGFANGIMLDADRRRFYCNDTFTCIWVFDVQPDLSLTNKRLLLDKQDADGLALDAQGNVWITGFRSSFITRVAPGGTALAPVETPVDAVTQVRFGGPDMRDMYITAVPASGGDNLKDGVALTEHNSFLYRARSEIPGMRIFPTRFRL
jgi:sugar lactone lactonase YvrE